MPLFFPLFCPDIFVFPQFLMDFAFFLGFVLTFFTPDPAKSQKTLKMVRNTIPCLFPFVLCVCFRIVFPNDLIDFALFFGFVLTFSTLTLQKVRKPWNWLQIEHCWVLLSAAGKSNSQPFSICFVCVFPLSCPDFIVFSKLFDGFCIFFWLRSHLFHPWPWKKSGNLEIGCRLSTAECCWVLLGNPIPSLFPLFCVCFPIVLSRFHCFFQIVWMDFAFFLASFSPFSSLTLEKVRKPWNWLQIEHCWVLLSAAECCWVLLSVAECCWVLLGNPIPILFPFFCLCFSFVLTRVHCFSNFFDGFCVFFGFVLSFFTPDPAKSQETFKLVADWALLSAAECCWVLLGNQIPILFVFVLCVFSHCFVQISLFFQFFDGFCTFFWLRSHLFHPWPCKKSGNLEIGCRLSTAECYWVLLSAAGKSNSQPLSICFVCVFPLFCPDFIVFSKLFEWILHFFLASFSPFSSLTLEKVRKPWNWLQSEHCWALLSAAECCWVCCCVLLRNPIPHLLPFVLCVCVCSHCFCPDFSVFPQFLMDFVVFVGFVFSSFTRKNSGNFEISCRLSTAEHCWALLRNAIPSLFLFVLLKFSLFLSPFLMVLVIFCNHSLCFSSWNCQKTRHFNK